MQKLLRVNTGHHREPPHEGVLCSTMRLPVTVTDQTMTHNGVELVYVLDALNVGHWIDPWYLDDAPNETPAKYVPDDPQTNDGFRVVK